MSAAEKAWEWKIESGTSYWGWSARTLWGYRHLMGSLIRRDFLLNYQQTLLGPLWVLLQPVLTLVTYVLVFGELVGIPTGTIPPVLFYFSGIVLWNFFSDSFGGTAFTFKDNAHIFSKVYFPRIVMPLSVVSTHFIRFVIQLMLLFVLTAYYWLFQEQSVVLSGSLLVLPFAVFLVGLMGLSLGLISSVMTAKYRDIVNLVTLGIRLFMFVTPVIYSVRTVPEDVRWVVVLNPLTPLFELFRFGLFGEGTFTLLQLMYSTLFIIVLFSVSLLVFNKQGDKLIDVV